MYCLIVIVIFCFPINYSQTKFIRALQSQVNIREQFPHQDIFEHLWHPKVSNEVMPEDVTDGYQAVAWSVWKWCLYLM